MHNSPNGNELQLQEFAQYLIRNRLAREEHSRFFVFWVRKFLEKAGSDSNLTLTERLDQYLHGLQAEKRNGMAFTLECGGLTPLSFSNQRDSP